MLEATEKDLDDLDVASGWSFLSYVERRELLAGVMEKTGYHICDTTVDALVKLTWEEIWIMIRCLGAVRRELAIEEISLTLINPRNGSN